MSIETVPLVLSSSLNRQYVNLVLFTNGKFGLLHSDEPDSAMGRFMDRLIDFADHNVFILMNYLLEISTRHIVFDSTYHCDSSGLPGIVPVKCHKFKLNPVYCNVDLEIYPTFDNEEK